MADYRHGYKYLIYIGTVGSTAATQLTNVEDVDYDTAPEYGETTVRGDGSAIPIVTEVATAIKPTITWKMTNKQSDTNLATLIAAARTGAPIAVRVKAPSTGLGYDGDCNISVKSSAPLKGVTMHEFTATANDEYRTPSLNV